jgi:ribosomal protein L22
MADDPKNDEVEETAPEETPAEDAKAEQPKAEKKPKAAKKPKAEAKADDAEAKADEAEEKPKPKRKPAAKKKPAAKDEAETSSESSSDEAEEKAKPAKADKPKRRRGSAEVSAGRDRKPAARRDAEGKVVVRAKARYVRTAPRKARLVVDHIRGKSVDEARAILIHTPRAASRDVLKLLDSAIANAENNHELVADELKIDRVFVDEGPTLKRFRPRALGRATQIRKRTSHMTILLTPK